MDDLISRQDAIDAIDHYIDEVETIPMGRAFTEGVKDGYCRIRSIIMSLPSARQKGKWIEYDNSHCECPFCHEEWSYFDNDVEHFDFCPRCGADLRGEEDE